MSPSVDVGTRVWAHETGRFDALGHAFMIRSSDAALGRYLERAFAALSSPGQADSVYSLVAEEGTARVTVYYNGVALWGASPASIAVGNLACHVNHQVIARNSSSVLVHAAAATRGGVGVVLPAAMEAGKTTLVAGLVRRGFRYLTDEAVAIHPTTLAIQPYPKPLSIDRGSWGVLGELCPAAGPELLPYLSVQWQVDPNAIRTGAVGEPTRPRLIVSPRYVPGAATRLTPVSRADMLVALASQTFHYHAAGRRNLEVLAAVTAACDCYRLVVGELGAACEAIDDLVTQILLDSGR